MLGLRIGLAANGAGADVDLIPDAPPEGWVLASGFWDDNLFWIDDETWSD